MSNPDAGEYAPGAEHLTPEWELKMRRDILSLTFIVALVASTLPTQAQTPVSRDPVLRRIWAEGIDRSQVYSLAQALLDSVGPRLTGSAGQDQATDWVTTIYRGWRIPVRAEQYGTWAAWRRGTTRIDLIAPRIRSLQGMLMTWSPGTKAPAAGPAIIRPSVQSDAEFESWLPQVRGKFVLLSYPEPTCRTDENWKKFAVPGSFERMQAERAAARDAWYADRRKSQPRGRDLFRRLEDAGAVGIVISLLSPPGWVQGWGVSKIGTATAQSVPELGLSCEDYGLLYRLAAHNQHPIIRVDADAQFLDAVPVSNVIAEIRGQQSPDEHVILSAHLDSWDAASGATDNGSGTVVIMEAMRILRAVYPEPRRTIVAAHWGGEEQGLNGSAAFAADHPDVVNGLQALFNQDSGTGRVVSISMGGFAAAGPFFRRWLAQMPSEVARAIALIDPGQPEHGTDHAAFSCHGAPAFNLGSVSWDYETYTWHTNLDTFDKLVFDDLKQNATLFAMLAYLASEDPDRLPHEPRVTPTDSKTGRPTPWPVCREPTRNGSPSGR